MAGAIKHMERSHYSYHKNNNAQFASFQRNAYLKSAKKKEKKETIGQRITRVFKHMIGGK